MIKGKYPSGNLEKLKELTSVLPYEQILANAMARAIVARMTDPHKAYPLAVEALVLALPNYRNIEDNVKNFMKKDWEAKKKEIEKKEKDKLRAMVLSYDVLMEYIKHQLEDAGLLLRFRELPFGGGYDK